MHRIDPGHFLGGEMKISAELARQGIDEKVASPLGMGTMDAANAVFEIANSNIVGAIKVVTVSKGYDPKDFSLLAFGGAGPLHATKLAEELKISQVIVPVSPGTFSALGLLCPDVKQDYVLTRIRELEKVDLAEIEQNYKNLEDQAVMELREQDVADDRIVLNRTMDLRYFGQGYEVNLTIPDKLEETFVEETRSKYNEKHHDIHGYSIPESPIEIVNLRLSAIGMMTIPTLEPEPEGGRDSTPARIASRSVFFDNRIRKTAVYDRKKLKAGNVIHGPAIIQEAGSNTAVFPDQTAAIDPFKNIIIKLSS